MIPEYTWNFKVSRGIESYLRRINFRWPVEVKLHLFSPAFDGRAPNRMWFWFLRFVHRSERGRGSPRFAKLVDLRRFQEVETCGHISYEKGGFRALWGLSTNNVHRRCSSSNPTTPRDRGDTTISNRVLPLSFLLFLFFLFLCIAVLIILCAFKIRWMSATNRSKTIGKSLLLLICISGILKFCLWIQS